MELKVANSAISEKWKVYTIGGFFCFFIVALFVTSNYQRTLDELSIGTAVVVTIADSKSSDSNSSSSFSIPIEQAVEQIVDSSSPTTTVVDMTNYSSSTAGLVDPTTAAANKSIDSFSTSSLTSSTSLPPPPVTASSSSASIDSSSTSNLTTSTPTSTSPPANTTSTTSTENQQKGEVKRKRKPCNVFEGKWVYKPMETPIYNSEQCPFLAGEASCRKNGRPDSDYQGWIWEPHDCQIPLFNGKDMLEKMRGKRIVFVGDSLNRNQWLSLACLIYTSVSPSRSSYKITEMYKVVKVKDYDFTLEFYWSPLLVDVDYKRKILRLDRLDSSSKQWRGADVMVFNSGHWWNHAPPMRTWDVVEYKGQLIQEIEKELAYERALSTWLTWLNKNVDPNKTKVFFRSISPEHKGKQFFCFNVTTPIPDDSYVNKYPQSMTQVVERTITSPNRVNNLVDRGGLTDQLFPVRYLNITRLSGYRKDAHPALYNKKDSQWKASLAVKHDIVEVAKVFADCSHWCLPGVPDTWNRLIYVSLFFSDVLDGLETTQ